MPRLHHTALFAVFILVIAACSSSEPSSDPTTSVASSTPSTTSVESTTTTGATPDPLIEVVTSQAFDPETNELVEVEETVGPTTYSDLFESGIEAGLWNELEGLELLLGHAVGAVPSHEVPGTDTLLSGEFTPLLEYAHELSLGDGYTEEELAPIRRWYELAVPGPDVIEMLETTSRRVGLSSFRGSSSAQASDCAPVDPDDFSDWGVVEGCYLMWSESVQGVTIRVFYPSWYESDNSLSGLPLAAGQALVQSVDTFAGFAPVGDIDAIFSLVDTEGSDGTLAVANDDATWGEASRGGSCPVTLFPLGFNAEFENTLAHEAWHCVQREMGFSRGVEAGNSWIEEGGAQYFANVVFPETAWFSYFESTSRTTSLFDMSYGAWVWWQFLASREGNGGVAQLHKQMVDAGDGGRGAMVGRAEQFQRFVVELMAGAIEGPVSLPAGTRVNGQSTVSKDDAGQELDFTTSGFTAARYGIRYDQELRVLESDGSPDDVNMAMVEWAERSNPDAWKEVFPEIRSKCDSQVWYVVAVTTETPQSGIESKITIDEVEEASCDPCVLGTWQLDNASFEQMLKSNMGGAIPAGSDFRISGGAYFISMDDEGQVQEQRDGFTISVSSGGISLEMVIDSFGTGDYSADGENLTMSNLVELFSRVDMGGFGAGGFDTTDSSALSGVGTYTCDDDVLEVTIPEGTVRWDRVDKILEPPPIEEG